MWLLLSLEQMLWRKNFFRFLKEEGVYSEWVYNIRKPHPTCDKKFWECTLKKIFNEKEKCAEAIKYAFYWPYTRQGSDFWVKIDKEWRYKCRNYFYKI